MPYLGRDWRSPGDQWVRTTEGWEKLRLWRVKLFENLNENFLARLVRLALTDWYWRQENTHVYHQPHIQFVKGTSRERKIHTSVSEAFIRLDLSGAVKDVRRFNYVCSLLEILITTKMSSLSGNTQKYLFHTLEEVLTQVLKMEYNLEAVRRLLQLSEKALNEGIHTHIGSQALWSQHNDAVARMIKRLETFQLTERENDGRLTFSDLPEDCIRDILLRLNDHKDIVHTGLTNSFIYELSEEKVLWKQLCFYNFSNDQLLVFIAKEAEEGDIDWKMVYRRCVKRFGRKDTFADMLCICGNCDCIFWKLTGHPCSKGDELELVCRPLNPTAFLSLFLL
ncbi:F-box only protein 32-like [Argonauta hians]